MDLLLLRLMQLADSALPIGSTAHSFGLEALIAEQGLGVAELPVFLEHFLSETGLLEAVYCHHASLAVSSREFRELSRQLSARIPAQRTREASATLGRRFFYLVSGLLGDLELNEWGLQFEGDRPDIHLCAAFGVIGRTLGASSQTSILAFLHQATSGLVSASQRLLPLGQTRAAQILWDLKPAMVRTAQRAVRLAPADVVCFTPALELASMRHSELPTRLFIS
jgi:urease accessory protein